MPTTRDEMGPKSSSIGTTHKEVRWNERSPATHAGAVSQFPFRILFVDDEPPLREIATQTLEGEGYEVLTAANGVDALEALSKSLPDVISNELPVVRYTREI